MIKLTFEELSCVSPQIKPLPSGVSTDFWENLYQLFKSRMIEEQLKDEAEND